MIVVALAFGAQQRWFIHNSEVEQQETLEVAKAKLTVALDKVSHILYVNSIAACQRGNVYRRVQFQNTKSAAEAGLPKFEEQLDVIIRQPYTNPENGATYCRKAIIEPKNFNELVE